MGLLQLKVIRKCTQSRCFQVLPKMIGIQTAVNRFLAYNLSNKCHTNPSGIISNHYKPEGTLVEAAISFQVKKTSLTSEDKGARGEQKLRQM